MNKQYQENSKKNGIGECVALLLGLVGIARLLFLGFSGRLSLGLGLGSGNNSFAMMSKGVQTATEVTKLNRSASDSMLLQKANVQEAHSNPSAGNSTANSSPRAAQATTSDAHMRFLSSQASSALTSPHTGFSSFRMEGQPITRETGTAELASTSVQSSHLESSGEISDEVGPIKELSNLISQVPKNSHELVYSRQSSLLSKLGKIRQDEVSGYVLWFRELVDEGRITERQGADLTMQLFRDNYCSTVPIELRRAEGQRETGPRSEELPSSSTQPSCLNQIPQDRPQMTVQMPRPVPRGSSILSARRTPVHVPRHMLIDYFDIGDLGPGFAGSAFEEEISELFNDKFSKEKVAEYPSNSHDLVYNDLFSQLSALGNVSREEASEYVYLFQKLEEGEKITSAQSSQLITRAFRQLRGDYPSSAPTQRSLGWRGMS